MKYIFVTVVIIATGILGYLLGSGQIELGEKEISVQEEAVTEIPIRFESEVVFQLNPFGAADHFGVPENSRMLMTRQYFETEFAIIKSEETLRRAIRDFKLDELLEKSGEDLLKEMSDNLSVEQELGTDLIRLTIEADSELGAEQISYAVIKSYEKRKNEALKKRRQLSLDAFTKKRKEQEDRVEENRKKLFELSKKLGIPYHGKNGRLGIDASSDHVEKITPQEATKFGESRENYEREQSILDAIKQAEFLEILGEGLERDLLVYHQYGWSDEVQEDMERMRGSE